MRYSAKLRPNSGISTSSVAASTTPICELMPPSTTMARMIADSVKVKLSGEMKPWRAAKNTPAKPPSMAPMANAESLMLVVFMPIALHAISSSRRASQARPTGSLRRRDTKAWVSSASTRIR